MFRKDYNEMILSRIEKSFDKIMPIGSIISWASALAIYFSRIPKAYVYMDVGIGVIFMFMYMFKRKLSAETKILITILIPTLIGVLSFMDGGFGSGGISLLMISNVVAVLYLNKRTSKLISAMTLIIFIALFIFSAFIPVDFDVKDDLVLWIIQFLVLILYLFILHTVVYSIRGYLLENIKDLEDSIEQTYNLAYFDQLTGLMNQYKFKEELLSRCKQDAGYLVIFNIKNLNLINSIYNDVLGDQVLVNTAEIFNNIKTDKELISRISGNEFALWINDQDLGTFLGRVEHFTVSFDDKFSMDRMTMKVEFFISYNKHIRGTDLEETFHKSRLALTYAKNNNERSLIAYDEILDKLVRHDEILKERLEYALKEKSFRVYYQAKVDSINKKVVSVEALSRWTDDLLGVVPPDKFIKMLEQMNASVAFGNLVIEKVFTDYKFIIKKYGNQVTVSINVSPSHLISGGFATYVKRKIIEHKIPSKNIIIEITEEVMINNFDKVSSTIDELRHMGLSISLDDFGSGYSSLNYLATLNIDEIKIDKSFVELINRDSKVNAMIEMIINLSKAYKINIVAEGVETYEQFDYLKDMGCTEIQGYLFSKPEPL